MCGKGTGHESDPLQISVGDSGCFEGSQNALVQIWQKRVHLLDSYDEEMTTFEKGFEVTVTVGDSGWTVGDSE